ncbi:hypothetical protein GPA10_13355 [Streptomyces sp. p1417]|uniref:Secreted protein n=1 Tax=Streptomyces typhae TaxID=2681492 RepID=A0A6L6WX80_9ACTN|nr:hypothetical protein [Streptomyces typhae]MVO85716.1 hypothetical protein [Streptomyces typhae]
MRRTPSPRRSVALVVASLAAVTALAAPAAAGAVGAAPASVASPLPPLPESLITEGVTVEGPLINNLVLPLGR